MPLVEIDVYIGVGTVPSEEQVKILVADICDALVINGVGNAPDQTDRPTSVVSVRLHEDDAVNDDFFETALDGALLAVVPITPTEGENEDVVSS